jgi:BirA family transcriptional regulator, biotin operon repressor / biotin---[acetyl-CoA-carboxylase] ligase
MKFTILRFDSVSSTNTEALEQAKRGAEEGLCVVARQQTAGRGRHGRSWISEKDAGLFFSLVLRPKIEVKFLPLITLMTAVAVYEALVELFQLNPDIKWANDVHVDGKKICGILAEMTDTSRSLAVIVGIGINLRSSNFPPDLKETATSVEEETNQIPDIEVMLRTLTRFLDNFYRILKSENGAEKIRREWAKRSSYFEGKNVKVVLENETVFGVTRGLEENGALRLETRSGEIKTVQAGDVEQLRKI